MFIERLTDEQLHNFAKSLIKATPEVPTDSWTISVNRFGESVQISIMTTVSESHGLRFYVSDFSLRFPYVGLFDMKTIKLEFMRFMYHQFGSEYKEAYLRESAKIFEEFEKASMSNAVDYLM